MFGFDRITFDPKILGGKACIRGMRISVALIVNLVSNGMATEEILAEYPDLAAEDIQQALRYAAWTAEDVFYVPAGAAATPMVETIGCHPKGVKPPWGCPFEQLFNPF